MATLAVDGKKLKTDKDDGKANERENKMQAAKPLLYALVLKCCVCVYHVIDRSTRRRRGRVMAWQAVPSGNQKASTRKLSSSKTMVVVSARSRKCKTAPERGGCGNARPMKGKEKMGLCVGTEPSPARYTGGRRRPSSHTPPPAGTPSGCTGCRRACSFAPS